MTEPLHASWADEAATVVDEAALAVIEDQAAVVSTDDVGTAVPSLPLPKGAVIR